MVGIVCFWDRPATPYLKKYEELLSELGVPFEVIFWNRSDEHVKDEKGYMYINLPCSGSKLQKLKIFFKWKSKITKILESKHYDKLIVLSTVPGILLYRFLLSNYRNNYLFDIRDYTLEANPIFGHLVTKLIENSSFTTISSKGYYEWLKPSEKIIPNHNITFDNPVNTERDYFSNKKMRFTFVGNVRLDVQTRMVLLLLKKSKRYISSFIGRIVPGCDILDLCEKDEIKNVEFQGQFNVEDKLAIYRNIDLINAVYANAPMGKIGYGDSTPLPNRIYDCVCFKVPIVCCKGIFLEELVNKYHLGFAIDAYSDNVEFEFDKYVNSFDKAQFLKGCDDFLKEVREEEALFIKQAKKYFEP